MILMSDRVFSPDGVEGDGSIHLNHQTYPMKQTFERNHSWMQTEFVVHSFRHVDDTAMRTANVCCRVRLTARPSNSADRNAGLEHTRSFSRNGRQLQRKAKIDVRNGLEATVGRQRSGGNSKSIAMATNAVANAGSEKCKVAVLGTGLLGAKVAERLIHEGFEVAVWNRTSEKCAYLGEMGAKCCVSATDALSYCDVVLLYLSDVQAIESTLFEEESALEALAGKCVVQMGTIGPAESKRLLERTLTADAKYLEAPVLGSLPEAIKGTLLVMVGAGEDPNNYTAWPVLQALGQSPVYIGDVGTAAAVKLALNQLIASLTVGFSTSLGLLQANNVDVDKFMGILRESALYAPTFDKKLQRMLDREYSNPNFPTKHLLKDINLFLGEAETASIDTSTLKGLRAVVERTLDMGLADTDYSALHDGVTKQ